MNAMNAPRCNASDTLQEAFEQLKAEFASTLRILRGNPAGEEKDPPTERTTDQYVSAMFSPLEEEISEACQAADNLSTAGDRPKGFPTTDAEILRAIVRTSTGEDEILACLSDRGGPDSIQIQPSQWCRAMTAVVVITGRVEPILDTLFESMEDEILLSMPPRPLENLVHHKLSVRLAMRPIRRRTRKLFDALDGLVPSR